MTTLREQLANSVVKLGPPCKTCTILEGLSEEDLAFYHAARDGSLRREDGEKYVGANVARAIGIQPSTYLVHVRNGHVEPR